MAKKSSLLLAAAAVLAFAVPAMGNAAVPTLRGTVTHAAIGVIPAPSITGTGTSVTLHSSLLGNITCSTITIEGKLTVNDMTNGITGENAGQAAPPATDCTNGTNKVEVTEVHLTDLKSTVGGEALATFTAEVDVGTEVAVGSDKCTFTGTNVKGTYTSGSDTLSFSAATGITGLPVACGKTGNTLTGSFVLELTSTGEKLEGFF